MATTLKKTNVVIIGLGAAGGVACLPLAQAGLEVIGLEAGSWLSTKDMAPDELKLSRGLWPPGPQKTKIEGVTSRANSSQTAMRANHPMMNAVGGTSVHYMAQSWRLNPWDFKVRSETIRRYGTARVPKGSTVEDWPLTYEELEPYYDRVEAEIGVSGKAGNIGVKKTNAAMPLKALGSGNIQCRPCARVDIWKRCRPRESRSVGIHSLGLPQLQAR